MPASLYIYRAGRVVVPRGVGVEWSGILPYISYIGMCNIKGYGFGAILVRK